MSTVTRPSAGALEASALRRVVAVLSISTTIAYGVLFYAFPVLLTTIARDTGWPTAGLAAGFTAGQLVAAGAGLWVGRRVDRRGPRTVMTVGSVIGVAGCLGVATTPSLALWFVVWLITGLGMSATFYPPAFTALTHWAAHERVRALTTVTLVAGFASTVFAPMTAVLDSHLGWRWTYLVLGVVLSTTIPLHWWALRDPWTPPVTEQDRTHHGSRPSMRTRTPHGFPRLVLAMTLAGFGMYAALVAFVPLQVEHGTTTTTAAVLLGVGGAGQVAGRLFYAPFLSPLAVRARTNLIVLVAAATILALAAVQQPIMLVAVLSFVAGGARGIFTLLGATAVTERWGTTAYGARTAVLLGCVSVATALAPWIGNLLATWTDGYTRTFVLLAVIAAVAIPLVPGDAAIRARQG